MALHSLSRPQRGNYAVKWVTGTIAAGLGAGGTVFIARAAPAPNSRLVYIRRLVVDYTCTTSFTTPLTQREFSVIRGSGAGTAATAIATMASFDTADDGLSVLASANGGDVRTSTTGTVNVGGVSFEGRELATLQLTGYGSAGNARTFEFTHADTDFGPWVLNPGQCIAVRTASAMDAAGTFVMAGYMEWAEEPRQ